MTDGASSSRAASSPGGPGGPCLGRFGLFSRGVTPRQAQEIESLGYGAV